MFTGIGAGVSRIARLPCRVKTNIPFMWNSYYTAKPEWCHIATCNWRQKGSSQGHESGTERRRRFRFPQRGRLLAARAIETVSPQAQIRIQVTHPYMEAAFVMRAGGESLELNKITDRPQRLGGKVSFCFSGFAVHRGGAGNSQGDLTIQRNGVKACEPAQSH